MAQVPRGFTELGNELVFVAPCLEEALAFGDVNHLYATDGSANGLRLVKDFWGPPEPAR